MDRVEIWHFLVSLGFCMVVAITIIAVIHKRFQLMMVDLCEGEARARFWTLATEAWFFLSGITSSLIWRPDGPEERQLFLSSISLVKNGFEGMSHSIILFSLGLIAFVVIRKFKGRETMDTQKEAA